LFHQHWESCLLPYPISPPEKCHYPAGCEVTVSCKSKLVENKLYKSSPRDNSVTGPTTLGPMCMGTCGHVGPGCCLDEVEARANQLYYEENCRGATDPFRNVEGSAIGKSMPRKSGNAAVGADGAVSVTNADALEKATPPALPASKQAPSPSPAPTTKGDKTVYFWHHGNCNGKASTAVHDVMLNTCYTGVTSRAFIVSNTGVASTDGSNGNATFTAYTVNLFHGTACTGTPTQLSDQYLSATGGVPCVGSSAGTGEFANERMQVGANPSPGADSNYACTFANGATLGECQYAAKKSASPAAVAPSIALLTLLATAAACGISQ